MVRAYPSGSGVSQVSPDKSGLPFWTKNGREIVYVRIEGGETAFWAVEVTPGAAGLTLGKPVKLFPFPLALPPNGAPYGVSRDGTRFALLREPSDAGARRTNVMIVLNFARDIERALGGR
jgi:hypothetical protein